jgi:hypothetical protein
METPESAEQSVENSNENTSVLKLHPYLQKYNGIQIREDGPSNCASTETVCGTIVIKEWVRPDWSDKKLQKLDFPEMGYLAYREEPLKLDG